MTNPTRVSQEATQHNTLGRRISNSSIITSLPDGTQIFLSLYPHQRVEVLYVGGRVKSYETLQQLEKDIPGIIQAQWGILNNQLFGSALPPDTLRGPPLQGLQRQPQTSSAPPRLYEPLVSSLNSEEEGRLGLDPEEQPRVGIPESTGWVTHLPSRSQPWSGIQPSLEDRDDLEQLFPSYRPLSAEGPPSHEAGYNADSEDDTSISLSEEANQLIDQQGGQLFETATPITSARDQASSSEEGEGAAGILPSSGHRYFGQATPIQAPPRDEVPSSAEDIDLNISSPRTIQSSFNFTSSVTSVERSLELDVELLLAENDHPRLYKLEGDPAD